MNGFVKLIFRYPNKNPFKIINVNKKLSNSKIRLFVGIKSLLEYKLLKSKIIISKTNNDIKCTFELNNDVNNLKL